MYKYETHLHTFPVSKCATADINEILEFYKKLEYDGSDNHIGARQKKLAGISTDKPICGVEDFVEMVKSNKAKIFTIVNE